jgi:hypothetical protein
MKMKMQPTRVCGTQQRLKGKFIVKVLFIKKKNLLYKQPSDAT